MSARQVEVLAAALGAGALIAFAAIYMALDAIIGEYDRRLVGSW